MVTIKSIRCHNILMIAIATATAIPAVAASHCVSPHGRAGCFASINAAVNAAAPNDVIQVFPGRYAEDVVIGKPLSLVGSGRESTIINASGMANGINIDGLDNSGLGNVQVRGFTVENAKFEGIVATNARDITLSDNRVVHNDKALTAGTCPGIPAWETAEGFDCGEGVHLSGVFSSVLSGNEVNENAGGILLSDDTGATHDNVLSGNDVERNSLDCGITLASHPPAPVSGSATPLGVFHNTVFGNESSENGLAETGEGAGVGIFTSVPGAQAYDNVVTLNRLVGNGLPGVSLHSHTPGQVITGNVIVGNYIARNHADTADATTPGTTGINIFGVSPADGTIVSQNTIEDEAFDVVVNTPAQVDVHLNNFHPRSVSVANIGPGSANAAENWWGCPAGPMAKHDCATVSGANVLFDPWLTRPSRFDQR